MITSDGSPASGLSVEFIDAQNEDFNIHTATDSNGHYSGAIHPACISAHRTDHPDSHQPG